MALKHLIKFTCTAIVSIAIASSTLMAQSATPQPAATTNGGTTGSTATTPDSAAPNPADTPSFKVGTLLFLDYTLQDQPKTIDADGNRVSPSSFNIGRAYINVTGNLNHRISFRVTPETVRESGTGSSLNGSYTFRLKFAFAQYNLDDFTKTKNNWVRFGVQQTPYLDFIETQYRYRFQGPMMVDREGLIVAVDAGVSGHYTFAGDHGDLHVGIYNGEGWARSEVNDQKALQARVAFKPMPHDTLWKGLIVGAFYDGDNYLMHGEKRRFAPFLILEQPWGKLGVEGIDAHDRTSSTRTSVHAQGVSLWLTPKLTKTLEVLLRHDDFKADTSSDGKKTRDIAGIAYWIPNLQKVTTAVLLDGERVAYPGLSRPEERRFALHLLLSF
jgi:hypothetical protein